MNYLIYYYDILYIHTAQQIYEQKQATGPLARGPAGRQAAAVSESPGSGVAVSSY